MDNYITATIMSLTFLVFLIPRRRIYKIRIGLFMAVYLLFTITGAFGASLGAFLSGMTWSGKRLHLLMAVDAVFITLFSKLIKCDELQFADFVSIPIVSVCFAAKVGCTIFGCCRGILLTVDAQGVPVYFPSQAFELVIWVLLLIWLLYLERKGTARGLLWPVAMVWFGIFRFLVDFLRYVPDGTHYLIAGIPAGQFWSLFELLLGILYFVRYYATLRRSKPTIVDFIKSLCGI